jgi:hypothetical protein
MSDPKLPSFTIVRTPTVPAHIKAMPTAALLARYCVLMQAHIASVRDSWKRLRMLPGDLRADGEGSARRLEVVLQAVKSDPEAHRATMESTVANLSEP